MPQFEQVDTFISQIFWLVTVFVFFYFMCRHVLLPRIARQIDLRSSQITGNLKRARELESLATAGTEEAEAIRLRGQAEASKMLHDLTMRITASNDDKAKGLHAELAKKREVQTKAIDASINDAMQTFDDDALRLRDLIIQKLHIS